MWTIEEGLWGLAGPSLLCHSPVCTCAWQGSMWCLPIGRWINWELVPALSRFHRNEEENTGLWLCPVLEEDASHHGPLSLTSVFLLLIMAVTTPPKIHALLVLNPLKVKLQSPFSLPSVHGPLRNHFWEVIHSWKLIVASSHVKWQSW